MWCAACPDRPTTMFGSPPAALARAEAAVRVTSEAVAARLQATRRADHRPGGRPGRRVGRKRAGFIAAQLLGLALCRYILSQEPIASLPAAEVVAAVAPSVQRYLTQPAGRHHPPGAAG